MTGSRLIGSDYNDRLLGDGAANFMVGAGGNDLIHGRGGNDFVMYSLASAGVVVDLLVGSATGGEGKDRLRSIENAIGSPNDDVLNGTSGDDYLDGAEGTDTIDGRGGNDVCLGEVQSNCPPVFTFTDEPPVSALNDLSHVRDLSLSGPTTTDLLPYYTARCYSGERGARFGLPPFAGYGYFLYATSSSVDGQSGYGPFHWTEQLFYYDSDGWRYMSTDGLWYWFAQGALFVPGDRIWVQAYYYSYQLGEFIDLGNCRTNPGGIVLVYR